MTQPLQKRYTFYESKKITIYADFETCLLIEKSNISELRERKGANKGDKYEDEQFRQNSEQIYRHKFFDDKIDDKLKNLKKWISITDNLVDEASIQRYLPKVDDFSQGFLGDCWLAAALLCLVNAQPTFILNIVPEKEFDKQTKKILWSMLCLNGKWSSIVIDDYFPCYDDGRLAFIRPVNHQYYASIIEKSCKTLQLLSRA